MKIDPKTGLAWLWHKERQEWVKRWPVDARDLVAAGECSYAKPDESADAVAAQPPGFTQEGPPSNEEIERRLLQLGKDRLQQLCQEHRVDWQGADTRTTLIKKLAASGVWVDDNELAASVPDMNEVDDAPHRSAGEGG